MSGLGLTGARTLRGGKCAKRRSHGHESKGVQSKGRKRPAWGFHQVTFLCKQSVIIAQAMAESPRALLLQSQHWTRVPTPLISPASPVGGASAHSCSPDSASDTPSVNLPTFPCGGQYTFIKFCECTLYANKPMGNLVERCCINQIRNNK